MTNIFSKFLAICRMIKIEHSVFALPFAYVGAFLAASGIPPIIDLLILTVAMVAVRSFAMAFNRLADFHLDCKNPRTQSRPLVTGEISLKQTKLFTAFMAILFVISCAILNKLCLILAIPTLVFAAGYSYTKRFTWLCHFWLGLTLGLAPVAGWISIDPSFNMTPLLFLCGVTFWVAGFDIFYSCMDMEFDQGQGLHSVPVRFGLQGALTIAAFCHAVTILLFFLAGLNAGLGVGWYLIWLAMSVVLFLEHRCVKADDLSKVNMAFFTMNGLVSVGIFVGVLLGLYF